MSIRKSCVLDVQVVGVVTGYAVKFGSLYIKELCPLGVMVVTEDLQDAKIYGVMDIRTAIAVADQVGGCAELVGGEYADL